MPPRERLRALHAPYIETADTEWFRQRLNGVVFWVVAAFVVLAGRLFYLQILEGREFSRLSENNCIRLQQTFAPRGLIYDRNGELLVDNRPSFDLRLTPRDAKPLPETLQRLARLMGQAPEELALRLSQEKGISPYRPVLLKADIGRDVLAAIEASKYQLPGVSLDVRLQRYYPHRHVAAHLIGYLSEINALELASGRYHDSRPGDYIGKFGVEKAYETPLRGQRGGRQVEVNVMGQVVRLLRTVEAQPGHNLYLTIDGRVQEVAESCLAGKVGAAVAIDPGSGEILAMTSSPAFDQNIFVDGLSRDLWEDLTGNPKRPLENKAIQAEYPPASTYKILTALAGLEEGVIDESTTFACPGSYHFGNRDYRCWKKGGHGSLNVTGAIAESCDVFFYQVGQRLGVDRLAWYAKGCGLGRRTGVELDHEAAGLIPTAAWKRKRFNVAWQPGETISLAIGQGYNLVTPIQMANFMAAIANGGTLYRPTLLHGLRSAEGDTLLRDLPQVLGKLPVGRKNLAIVQRGLFEVVNGPRGTAKASRIEGVAMSGKTGTAQVVGGKTDIDESHLPEQFKPHAWFVAYAPSEAPRIAVAVMIEHGEHGSSAAAPVAQKMIKAYLEGVPAAVTASR
jgi:penicillin-binding protein 2